MRGRKKKRMQNRPPNASEHQDLSERSDSDTQTEAKQRTDSKIAEMSFRAASFSGPLPPPGILAQYNEIIPGLADRLVVILEDQSKHRRELEKRVIFANTRSETLGQIFALIIALAFGIGSLALIHYGKSIEGITGLVTVVTGLVGVFIYGRHRQKNELAEKRQGLPKKRGRS